MYDKYKETKFELIKELQNLVDDNVRGRYNLVSILYKIINGKNNVLESNIINKLLNRNRPKLKSIIKNVAKGKEDNIDFIIATTIRLKMGYIEHEFYTKVLIIRYFLENEKVKLELINKLNEKVVNAIEQLDKMVWGWGMILLLLGTHIFMTVRTGFIQRKLGTATFTDYLAKNK